MNLPSTLALLIAFCFPDCMSAGARVDEKQLVGRYESSSLGVLDLRPGGVLLQRIAGRQVEARWTVVTDLGDSCQRQWIEFKGLVHDAGKAQTSQAISGTVSGIDGVLSIRIDGEASALKK